jgi:hypothetical protein
MGKTYESIGAALRTFIEAQAVFFVASAPLSAAGHVNLSPKGRDSLRVLDDRRLAYLDFVGSGAETIAHLEENARIVLMWCAFDGPARIVRVHGRGRVVEPQSREFEPMRRLFPEGPTGRAIILIEAERISDSCGFGVPRYGLQGERTELVDWTSRKSDADLRAYQRSKNRESIDGLPAVTWLEP